MAEPIEPGPVVDFRAFVNFLLPLAQERSLDSVMERCARYAESQPHFARAALWFMEEESELTAVETQPQLKLAASAGKSRTTPEQWRHAAGHYGKVPLDEPLIGRVAEEMSPRQAVDERAWARPDWALAEGIVAYAAYPLLHTGKLLGVVAFFYNCPIRELLAERQKWHLIFADYLGAAIANTQAFEKIERLRRQLELENAYLREEVKEAYAFGEIVGQSQSLGRVLDQLQLVAPTESPVLILGESGTGKELIARAIHERSSRRDHPLIRVNCASIPRELFESEFFGHVRGAFTGAVRDRTGRFQLADAGTIFLDEVGEIPLELQSKLLRILQEGTFERVGDERTRRVNVRIISATNRDLLQEVEAGRFRRDLYFRLSVFPLQIPPLRNRLEDIPLLARHFLHENCSRLGIPEPVLKRRHILELQSYPWPGNIRELQNVIERAAILSRGGDLQFDVVTNSANGKTRVAHHLQGVAAGKVVTEEEWKKKQRENIVLALDQAGWKIQGKGGAAELLGIKPTTLRSRMDALGLQTRD